MSDATRSEAIEWCREHGCDFIHAQFPPPSGWLWAGDRQLTLTAIFTNTNDADITHRDVWPDGAS